MRVSTLDLPEVLLIEPEVHSDSRGEFFESWHLERYAAHGLPAVFRQDNVSHSRQGVLRGLHFQHPGSQGKLVSVLRGEIFDVAVDVRLGSTSFGRWSSVVLSAESARQLYVPAGFAHGFAVMSSDAIVSYKCSEYYATESECTVRWDDPDLGIPWPLRSPALSQKDAEAAFLRDISESRLPPAPGPPPDSVDD